MQEGSGGDTYVQQRGCGDFTCPIWARPGLLGLVCPAATFGWHPLTAVEEVLQVVVLLPPSSLNLSTSSYSQVT
jgi:hypothetical protein